MIAFEHLFAGSDRQVLVGLLGLLILTLFGFEVCVEVQAQGVTDYASYLGGAGEDFGVGSHQLANGDVILVMQTGSADLVTTPGSVKSELTGSSDAYIIRFNPATGETIWASYFGGDLQDWVFGMDCDDEASTCGFTGAREISGGTTSTYAAIFAQDGALVCSNIFGHGVGSTVGNHYDNPPEDEDFDDANGAIPNDFEVGPVIFGSVQTARGDLDGAIWMLDPQTCDTLAFWTTGIPTDDTFLHGFINPGPEGKPRNRRVAIHGFGAVDGDANGGVANSEEPLQCVAHRTTVNDWQFECGANVTGGGGQMPEIYVEAAYDDHFGMAVGTYEPMTGNAAIDYWESSAWPDAIAEPTARFELGAGLPRGISIEANGLLSLTTWRFDGEDFKGVEVVRAFVHSPDEVGEESLTFLESVEVEGGPAVRFLPGNNQGLFVRSLTGYAGSGLAIPDGALQTECEVLIPGSTCGLYLQIDERTNYATGCNVSPTPTDWAFTSDPVAASGTLQPASCTRLLAWDEERGFRFSLIDATGDTTAFSSDDGLVEPFTLVLADRDGAAMGVAKRPEQARAHMLYVTNWLNEEVRVRLESGSGSGSGSGAGSGSGSGSGKSGLDTLAAGSGLWYAVTAGGQANVIVESELGNEASLELTFPYRDFIQYAVISHERSHGREGVFKLAVFDDRGRLQGAVGFPPVSTETQAGVPGGIRLHQNYPNPFGESTVIRYQLDAPGSVELAVFDLFGRQVRTLESTNKSRGTHVTNWDGRDAGGTRVATGVYVLRLETAGATLIREIVFVR